MVRRSRESEFLWGGVKMTEVEVLMDLIVTLQSDLGGSLKRHVSDLNKYSDQEDIREALHRALYETSARGDDVISAREVWNEFAAKTGPELADVADYKDLTKCVQEVLEYEGVLADPDISIDRQELKADFATVSDAIRDLVIELRT